MYKMRGNVQKRNLVVHNTESLVRSVLDEVFSMGGSANGLAPNVSLSAALPGLDSMAATAIITLIEERLSLSIEPGDVSGADFASLATLVAAVDRLRRPGQT